MINNNALQLYIRIDGYDTGLIDRTRLRSILYLCIYY